MEMTDNKQYAIDNGRIRVQRHFAKSGLTKDIVRAGVLNAAKEAALLTSPGNDDNMKPLSLREPQ